ncbi:MAG: hypothetical protein L6420_09640, partial [Elusimicrobia bacterium]|nr:hypothetical protein [Elusimicrobiota bacterium]
MRKSFISLIILISFPLLVAAGFNFGFIKAVKKKVEKLDKKVQTKKAKAISSIPVSEVIVGSWTYGVSSNNDEYSVQQTTDGGYIIATASGSTNVDIWLLKTDSNGNKLWDKTFGGVGNENAYSVQQTSDGGYIIAGSSNSSGGGNHDFWLIKTDSSG